MKKITIMLCLFAVIVFSGCVSKFTPIVSFTTPPTLANVEIVEVNNLKVVVKITNHTNDVVEIDWVKSSLANSPILLEGQRLALEGSSMVAPTILPPSASTNKTLHMSDGFYYTTLYGTIIPSYPKIPYPAILSLKLKQKDYEEYAIVSVDVEKEETGMSDDSPINRN